MIPSNPFGNVQSAVVAPNKPMVNQGGMTKPAVQSPNTQYGVASAPIGGLIGQSVTPGGLQGNIRPPVEAPQNQTIGGMVQRPGGNMAGGVNVANQRPPNGAGGLSDYRDQVGSAYEAQTRRLDPRFEEREAAFRQRMVNQGIAPGSAAYDRAFANESRDRNDAYNSAGFGAEQFGLTAYDTLTGHDLQRENMTNQQRIAQIGANASMHGANTAANANMYGADLRNQLGNAQLGQQGQQFNDTLNQQNYQFDVNDIFRNYQQDSQNALGFGQLGLAQDQFGLQSWQAQNQADQNYFNNIGALFSNAPGFTGFSGSSGLGSNAVNAGQAQAQADAAQMQAIGSMIGGAAAFSSEKYKDIGDKVDNAELLQAVNGMQVFNWKYNDNAPTNDRTEHIGTTSEQFYTALGMKEKDRIDTVDMGGALTGAIQELTERVEALENADR